MWKGMACAWMALSAMHAPGQIVAGGLHPITPAMLVEALAKEEPAMADANIAVPAGIVAREAAPDFVVLSVEPAAGAGDHYWVKIGCRNAGECLPFFASVATDKPLKCGGRQQSSGRVVAASIPVMHAGDHAKLVIRRERSVIELVVVALESGGIGQTIRIASPDYRQMFHGQIVSATELEGGMQ